jgi:predicted ribosomally synthesized peptide with SipW-like signal peptide
MKISGRRMRRRAVALAIANMLLLGVTSGAVTTALFTDSDAVPANAFSVGTIDLTTSPSSALYNVTNMLPGDSVIAALTLTNSGSSQLRYAMTTVATDPDGKGVRDQLELTIKTKTSNPCSSFDGTSLFSGALSAAALGDPTAGSQIGDRTLNASASEVLCFKVLLPGATDDDYQGATTTATLTFAAEQTANNP